MVFFIFIIFHWFFPDSLYCALIISPIMVNVISYILKFLSKFNTNYGNFFLIFNKIKRVVISLLYGDCKDQI